MNARHALGLRGHDSGMFEVTWDNIGNDRVLGYVIVLRYSAYDGGESERSIRCFEIVCVRDGFGFQEGGKGTMSFEGGRKLTWDRCLLYKKDQRGNLVNGER